MNKNFKLKTLAVAGALVMLASTAHAQDHRVCTGIKAALKNKENQIKAETAKYNTTFRNLLNYRRLEEKEFNKYVRQEQLFDKNFTVLANRASDVLGRAFVDDVTVTVGGAAPGTIQYNGETFHDTIATAATSAVAGTFIIPFMPPAPAAVPVLSLGDPTTGAGSTDISGVTIRGSANFLFGDPANTGLSATESAKIRHQHEVLLAKLQGSQLRMYTQNKALATYATRKSVKEAKDLAKLTRFLAAITAASTKVYGVVLDRTTATDPRTQTYLDGITGANLWGVRNQFKFVDLPACLAAAQ